MQRVRVRSPGLSAARRRRQLGGRTRGAATEAMQIVGLAVPIRADLERPRLEARAFGQRAAGRPRAEIGLTADEAGMGGADALPRTVRLVPPSACSHNKSTLLIGGKWPRAGLSPGLPVHQTGGVRGTPRGASVDQSPRRRPAISAGRRRFHQCAWPPRPAGRDSRPRSWEAPRPASASNCRS